MLKHFINFLIVWFIGVIGTNFLCSENPGSLTHYMGVSLIVSSNIYRCFAFGFQDIHAEAAKKRRRTAKKPYSRSIVGATLEVIQKKRTEKAEVRDAAREAALR